MAIRPTPSCCAQSSTEAPSGGVSRRAARVALGNKNRGTQDDGEGRESDAAGLELRVRNATAVAPDPPGVRDRAAGLRAPRPPESGPGAAARPPRGLLAAITLRRRRRLIRELINPRDSSWRIRIASSRSGPSIRRCGWPSSATSAHCPATTGSRSTTSSRPDSASTNGNDASSSRDSIRSVHGFPQDELAQSVVFRVPPRLLLKYPLRVSGRFRSR